MQIPSFYRCDFSSSINSFSSFCTVSISFFFCFSFLREWLYSENVNVRVLRLYQCGWKFVFPNYEVHVVSWLVVFFFLVDNVVFRKKYFNGDEFFVFFCFPRECNEKVAKITIRVFCVMRLTGAMEKLRRNVERVLHSEAYPVTEFLFLIKYLNWVDVWRVERE